MRVVAISNAKLQIFLDETKNSSYFCVKNCLIPHIMALKILLGWLVFVAIVYLLMWFDITYYKYNLPEVYRKILDTFTEED